MDHTFSSFEGHTNGGMFTGTTSLSGPMFGVGMQNSNYTPYDLDQSGGFLPSESPHTVTETNGVFLPLKIGMINRAWLAHPENQYLEIEGARVDVFRLVGHVRAIKQNNTKLSFLLDDGTGVIICEYLLMNDLSDFEKRRIQEFTEPVDLYLKIFGKVNAFGKSVPSIQIHSIHRVQDPNFIAFHDIDVCYNLLKLKEKSGISKPSDGNNSSISLTLTNTTGSTTVSSVSSLKNEIYQILKENAKNDCMTDGLHLSKIAQLCCQRMNLQEVSSNQMLQAIQALESESSICSTINQQTFNTTGA